MGIEQIVEKKIREAMERGDFDNLPGQGKPQDHNAYFDVPEDLRMGYSVLKNAGFLPREAQLLKDIESLRNRQESCSDDVERRQLLQKINEKRLEYDISMERYHGRRRSPHKTGR